MNARLILLCALLLGSLRTAAQRVDNAEYFWDTDPGPGNANGMSATDGAFDSILESIFLDTGTLPSQGAHTLGIRVKDQSGNWGPTFTTVVAIGPPVVDVPLITINQAEFYWDADPGAGNGTPMIAFDGNFNDALEAIELETAALPADGVHVLNVRSKDANDVWSLPFSVVVEVLGGTVTFPEINVTAAEYYVNDDPGFGLGAPMLAADGDFSEAFEAVKGGGIPAPVTAGVNILWLRARDAEEVWGPSFGIVVNIDTTLTGTTGLDEFGSAMSARVVPNPADGADGFTVVLDRASRSTVIRMLDASGRLVTEQRFNGSDRLWIELSGIAPGVYHVAILRDGTYSWDRLVVH